MDNFLVIRHLTKPGLPNGHFEGSHNFGTDNNISLQLVFLVVVTSLIYFIQNVKKSSHSENSGRPSFPQVTYKWGFSKVPIINKLESFYSLYWARTAGLKMMEDIYTQYGGVAELNICFEKFYIMSDSNAIQNMVTSADPGHLNKAKWFYDRVFIGPLKYGLVAADVQRWAPHRKILSRAFTFKSLQSYLATVNKYSKPMAEALRKAIEESPEGSVSEGKIHEIEYYHTIKTIGNIVMGADICEDNANHEFQKDFRVFKKLIVYRLLNPWFLVEPIWWLHPKRNQLNYHMNKVFKFIDVVTDKYKEKRKLEKEQGIEWIDPADDEVGLKPFRCMIEEMLHAEMDDEEIRAQVLTFMAAGFETNTAGLNYLLFHLAANPVHQQKCREEIDEFFMSKNIDADLEYNLTVEDLASLKYLDRCVLETLRLTPTIPVFIRRLESPLNIDDKVIDAGKNVIVVPWTLHRDPKIYPEPEKFDPDRFLPDNIRTRNQYAYLPFSGGPRNCIGYKLAIMQMKVLTIRILRHFEMFTTDKMKDLKFMFEITLSADREINLTFKKRSKA